MDFVRLSATFLRRFIIFIDLLFQYHANAFSSAIILLLSLHGECKLFYLINSLSVVHYLNSQRVHKSCPFDCLKLAIAISFKRFNRYCFRFGCPSVIRATLHYHGISKNIYPILLFMANTHLLMNKFALGCFDIIPLQKNSECKNTSLK